MFSHHTSTTISLSWSTQPLACAKAQLGASWKLGGENRFLFFFFSLQHRDCTRTSSNGQAQVEMGHPFGWVWGEKSEWKQQKQVNVWVCLLRVKLGHLLRLPCMLGETLWSCVCGYLNCGYCCGACLCALICRLWRCRWAQMQHKGSV